MKKHTANGSELSALPARFYSFDETLGSHPVVAANGRRNPFVARSWTAGRRRTQSPRRKLKRSSDGQAFQANRECRGSPRIKRTGKDGRPNCDRQTDERQLKGSERFYPVLSAP
jgi:hypothetical protein